MPKIPAGLGPVAFAAAVADLRVNPVRPARVVINERTGTIVAGGDVHIAPVAIAHGGLTIRVTESPVISQPPPLAGDAARTLVVPESQIAVTEGGSVIAVPASTTLSELAQALNAIGVSSGDVIAIFQALKEVGALDAELVIL